MATMDYENENDRYEEEPRYGRDRSASPRVPTKREDNYRNGRDRSASPGGRMNSRGPPPESRPQEERDARNPGSNLFVTGIHPRLTEADVSRLFEKYGEVEGCSIMKDPHTDESRGFGFVKMVTAEQADAAKEGLQGETIEGRTLSIEKARRSRPRTPTPGKYFGPPKREDDNRGPPRRFNDDRRYPGGRDDYYRTPGSSRYEDRDPRDRRPPYGSRRDDYSSRGIDRYASDRYPRDDRRGGGGNSGHYSRGEDREGGRDGGRDGGGRDGGRENNPRDGGYGNRDTRSNAASYGGGSSSDQAYVRESYGGRVHDNSANDRYSRR